jgi:hypothetical protein
MTTKQLDFANLVNAIQDTHETFAIQASKAVNVCLTIRNWLIGHYIVEYELQGADRANYGDFILEKLSEHLDQNGLKRMDIRELRRFRQFYACYPHIRESVTPVLASLPLAGKIAPLKIRESVTPELQATDLNGISLLSGRLLVERLSFTHFVELMQIDSPIKRICQLLQRTSIVRR